MQHAAWKLALAILLLTQTSCIAVGYSSPGGWFIWPGGLGLVIIIVILYFVFRRV